MNNVKAEQDHLPGVSDVVEHQRRLGIVERTTAVVLICVFVVALTLLALVRADAQWDRLLFLLNGLEALVFAGAGALFGTSVQRSAVVSGKIDAEAARAEVRTIRSQMDDLHGRMEVAQADAEKGRALARAVQANPIPSQFGTTIRDRPGARDEELPDTGDQDLSALKALAVALFPPA